MGVLVPLISSTTSAALGILMAHNASKSLADGDGTYTSNVLALILGICIILGSGLLNKMLE